ncbi:MAG TPA: amino acid ABC transporter permease [Bradyrhizobium sp.]|jgi:polar amino acid transport system permease protein|uniref:amino acid ABC transporter permease n=1 Tax=Bradyrhizobium sp. TaxID=376 RepID=UPI002CD63523|nr:amino acid ABC transporter permease [Bradyrhizobium sp.]HTB03885.1 amino acid ABC transporter permease [Bradyrhizobium sp.]
MQKFLADASEFFPILLQGVGLTILVTVGSLVLSTILGLVWAMMRVSGIRVLSGVSAGLINLIRGIPIIVLLFYLYFVMPDFGITLTALQAAILGLGIAYSAYQAENFRAGIEAIDKGQIEAAQTIGMGWWLTMRRVVLPQAVRIVLPPYGNIMIMLLKDSSQASTITVAELALQGKLIASSTFKNTSVFTLVALMYLTMSIPLILLVRHLEKRASRR